MGENGGRYGELVIRKEGVGAQESLNGVYLGGRQAVIRSQGSGAEVVAEIEMQAAGGVEATILEPLAQGSFS